MKFEFFKKIRSRFEDSKARAKANEIYDAENEVLKTLNQVPAKEEIAKSLEGDGNLSFYVRHTNKARYNMDYSGVDQTYPLGHKMNPETQMEEIRRLNVRDNINEPELDVKPEGILYAQSEARKFFARLKLLDRTGLGRKKPVNIFSSTELRAMVTAKQYVLVGEEMGFTVNVQPDTGTKISGELGQGKIKSMNELSVNTPKALLILFNNLTDGLPEVKQWKDRYLMGEWGESFRDELKQGSDLELWEEARRYVIERLKRSDEPWGEVFARLGKEVGDKFFHGKIQTAEKIHENQFLVVNEIVEKNKGRNSIDIYVSHEEFIAGQLGIQGLPHTVKNCEPWLIKDGEIIKAN